MCKGKREAMKGEWCVEERLVFDMGRQGALGGSAWEIGKKFGHLS